MFHPCLVNPIPSLWYFPLTPSRHHAAVRQGGSGHAYTGAARELHCAPGAALSEADHDVAQRLGISQGHVSDLVNGRFWPSRAIAIRIWRLTKGAVTPNDFLTEEERGEKPPKKGARS